MTTMLAAQPAAAEDNAACASRFADASAQFRDALYQSAPQHPDGLAATAALQAFRAAWSQLVDQWEDCRGAVREETSQRLQDIAEIASKAAREAAHGRLDQAHQTIQQVRPMLADMRHAGSREFYADHLDAFDDKLAEMADDDLDESEISPDQFVQLCEQIGVLGYLDERLEKHAPKQWAADPAFLDTLENLARQIRGLKVAILRGQRAPIRAALSDLRRNFDRLYLLYG
ncbi:MAG TPA: hypothetical protein VN809_09555 [Telmatospirillum sp.]|nr:hypothetical protein [Telmatospirillum sp.]